VRGRTTDTCPAVPKASPSSLRSRARALCRRARTRAAGMPRTVATSWGVSPSHAISSSRLLRTSGRSGSVHPQRRSRSHGHTSSMSGIDPRVTGQNVACATASGDEPTRIHRIMRLRITMRDRRLILDGSRPHPYQHVRCSHDISGGSTPCRPRSYAQRDVLSFGELTRYPPRSEQAPISPIIAGYGARRRPGPMTFRISAQPYQSHQTRTVPDDWRRHSCPQGLRTPQKG
jgi:hypothetical protein